MATMKCGNPLPMCVEGKKTAGGFNCRHAALHPYQPDCLIPCSEDRICKEIEEKPDRVLVAQL